MSVAAVQDAIGSTIGAFLSVGAMFLVFTSLGGAFISGCPFRSAFSGAMRFIFETLSKWILRGCHSWKGIGWLWIGIYTILSAAVAFATLTSGAWSSLFFSLTVIPLAYSVRQEGVHKPQNYKISCLALWMFLFVSLPMIITVYSDSPTIIVLQYVIAALGIGFACWVFSKVSKSMANTGEIDAIAWLLITAPPQYPATCFRKAGQLTGFDSIGRHYRPRLLESLMPLRTILITSYHAPEHHSSDTTHSHPSGLSAVVDNVDEDRHLKNLEIYLACLARLSEFKNYEGTFWCLWEDAMQHPKLEQPLIDRLVALANDSSPHFQVGLKSAAIKVLNNYELDMEGNPVRSRVTGSWSVATVVKGVLAMLMTNGSRLNSQEGHPELHRPEDPATGTRSSDEIREVKREPGESGMC